MTVRREYAAAHGRVAYWVTREPDPRRPWLVFLHGMLVDHRLFAPQLEHFGEAYNVLAWDSPAHSESRPYSLDAIRSGGVLGVAEVLLEVLADAGVTRPVLVGQSFGGMVAQASMSLEPGLARGFVGVDTMPMSRALWRPWQIRAIRHMEPVLRMRSWEQILAKAPAETSVTEAAQQATREMLSVYDREEYIQLAATTFRAMSDTVALGLPLRLPPTLLLCGEHDGAGMIRGFNRAWALDDAHPSPGSPTPATTPTWTIRLP
ncbi:alpha/beta fold hydrolase [Corynebacterium aquatimens]|uniref:alpha/beta fold hydrolase n=1 Tax=Corynebacterium aquatimens TaxID=1190508 RepID=UPI0025420EB0|nr:alpha/beta hydrolase [Corynebacterium aquatimens]QYH19432.1 alpha/beta fold hydrolase [Corynebacterium aquatimens]